MKKLLVCVCLLLCLSTVFAGCTLFDYGDDEHTVPLGTPLSVRYTEYQVIKGNIVKSIVTTCEVKSNDAQKYSFGQNADGKLFDKYAVSVGTVVKAGDILCSTQNGINITSEVDGTVRYINAEYSNYVKGDKQVVSGVTMVVVAPELMENAYGYMKLSENMINGYTIGLGSKVTMYKIGSTDANREFTGKIIGGSFEDEETEKDRSRDKDTLNIEYYIDIKNATSDIKVGDRLSITYTEAEAKDVLMVPVSAVYSYNGRSFVYILDSQGLKKECYIETGLEGESFIEIVSGLELGQRIIQY